MKSKSNRVRRRVAIGLVTAGAVLLAILVLLFTTMFTAGGVHVASVHDPNKGAVKVSKKVDKLKPISMGEYLKSLAKYKRPVTTGGIYSPLDKANDPIGKKFNFHYVNTGVTEGFNVRTASRAAGITNGKTLSSTGNIVLAGHNMRVAGVLFSDLHLMRKGTVIWTTDRTHIYRYVVSQASYHLPISQLKTYDYGDGKDRLTLFTCDYGAHTSDFYNYRDVVVADKAQTFQVNDKSVSNIVKEHLGLVK